jgi:hypothetical protein
LQEDFIPVLSSKESEAYRNRERRLEVERKGCSYGCVERVSSGRLEAVTIEHSVLWIERSFRWHV